ncbi:MAG TPA: hypothetical protein VG125_06780 [Pirellulales bacterium]|jgi:hypothetical protein|nr:hypothetical protein [Pirellulales bacterium]
MPEVFDPYRKWLGIPPAEQPPHLYRLLGIGLFEDDADTIAIAADRQMAHVRTFQAGPHSALSQKLLNELAAARLTLLDPKKKAAYDQQLRGKLSPSAPTKSAAGEGRGARAAPEGRAVPPRPQPSPSAPVPPAAGQGRGGEPGEADVAESVQDSAEFLSSAAPRLRRRRKRQEPAVWLGLVAAALALAGVVYLIQSQVKTETESVAVHKPPSETSPASQPSNDSSRPADAQSPPPADDPQPPVPEPRPEPKPTTVETESHQPRRGTETPTERDAGDQPDGPNRKPPSEKRADETKPPDRRGDDRKRPSENPQPEPPRSLADLTSVPERAQLARTHRDAAPEGKALTAASGRFSQQYGKEIAAAKTPEARAKVALKIWNEARDGSQTADLRYVMLDNVGKEALLQGSVGLAYRVTAEVARQFEVDPLAIRLKALETAGKMAQAPDACAIGALQALSVADRAAAGGKLDVASKAAGQATIFARKTKDKDLVAQTDRRKAGLREQSTRGAAYKKALTDLKKTPDDREANLTAGKYEVLVLGDWQEGLKKLAASGQGGLADVARWEAMARVDLGQWAPLAAAWWQASEAEADDFFKSSCRLQAKYCYLRARKSGRAGEVPPNVAEQLKSLPGYPMSRLVPGVAARYYDGGDFQRQRVERAEPAIDFYYGQSSPDPPCRSTSFPRAGPGSSSRRYRDDT